jgi:hypothetical protein
MPQGGRDLDGTLADVREYSEGYRQGTPESFGPCRDLMQLLLDTTVVRPGQYVTLTFGDRARAGVIMSGHGINDPVLLNDGNYLRVAVSLALELTDDGSRMKVVKSAFQYQRDKAGDEWIFRYDYLRVPAPGYAHPPAHLQIKGDLSHQDARWEKLKDIHFPTGRVSIEAVIRTLIVQFGVSTNEPDELWMPVLSESEAAFLSIAHRPASGPEEPA